MKITIPFLAVLVTATLAARRLPCEPDGSCPTGQICAKKPNGVERCVTPMKAGGPCKRDPFWICEEGLTCKDNTCTRMATKGETCVPPFTECEAGMVCAEKSPTRKKCVKPMPLGGACKRDPFWICEEGLKCFKNKCVPDKGQEGESCVPPGVECDEGLVCAEKSATRKKCVKPMPEGKPCQRDPFWICADGLICVKNVCVKETAEEGESCVPPSVICGDGLVCAEKSKTRKKCVKPMPKGKPCKRDPFWICEEGLKCVKNICVA